MSEQVIEALVEGGKASAGPPIGPALGPLGVNVGEVISEINKETASYEGMTIPVKIIIDDETKEFEIEIGSPPTSALVKKELSIGKGSGDPDQEIVGDLSISQLAKIAEQKEGSSLAKNKKARASEILGTCVSMGVTIEGKDPREVQLEIKEGKYDEELR